jgi:hypothetical protein
MYHLCPGCEVETYGELLCPDCRTAGALPQDGAMREDAKAALEMSAPEMQVANQARGRSVWAWLRPAGERSGWSAPQAARR